MPLHLTRQADVVIVAIEGQLIVSNRQELKQRVLDEAETGARKILVDFERTGYIDSAGLGVLVGRGRAPAQGQRANHHRNSGAHRPQQ